MHEAIGEPDAPTALRAALAGHYEIEREIGRGGMAAVFLARDVRHGRRVAVKVLDRAMLDSVSGERFLREIRLMAALQHPHVLPLHDSGASDGLLYYVMPYVEGETLRARLARSGALPLTDAVRLMRELADALAHAHAHDVVHRDLKPENVLLTGGHAVVADFGIARAVRRAREGGAPSPSASVGHGATTLTEAGMSLGTPAYMAPEQVTGDATADPRADLYALGIVAYEMLAGTHPFAGRTAQAMAAAHLVETPAPLARVRSDVPPALAELVMRLLAKDPGDRPSDAAAVVRALDEIATAPVRAFGNRRALVASVGALVAIALGTAGIAWWRARPAEHVATAPLMVAVLPFVNLSGDVHDDYFSDGLTDELADALAHVPGLRIAGRSSSYAFKGKSLPATEIGKALGVARLVEGTTRRAGDRLRVRTQLVSASDGTVLWDSTYESRSRDVFAVQDSLTRAVMASLAPALGSRGRAMSDASRGTADEEAYELYLKGRYYWHERGAENVERSIELFQQAIARDPTFARAYTGLALAYDVLGVYVPDLTDSTAALIKANARRALALDSTIAEAHLAMALAVNHEVTSAASEAQARAARRVVDAEFRTARRLEPAYQPIHHAFGGWLVAEGRLDEAITELRLAVQLDPMAKSAGTMLVEAFVDARRFGEAEAEGRRVMAIDSTFQLAYFSLGLAQAFGGHPDSAVTTLERGLRLNPKFWVLYTRLAYAYAAAGRWSDVDRLRQSLRRPGGDPSGGMLSAYVDYVWGDHAPLLAGLAARDGLTRLIMTLRPTFTNSACFPLLDPLWDEPAFRDAMRARGIARCPYARPWRLPPRRSGQPRSRS